jgi:uncharacterized membrane protein
MPSPLPAVPVSVVENIETVIRLEEEEASRRPPGARLADTIAGFVGSLPFVALHALGFLLWMLLNVRLLPLPPFDPYPFPFLTMFVSLEGVLLSTFVLIKQNRMSRRGDRRSHLDLQINLLTEKEVTKLIQMMHVLAERLGADAALRDAEWHELSRTTAVDQLARDLESKLPEE